MIPLTQTLDIQLGNPPGRPAPDSQWLLTFQKPGQPLIGFFEHGDTLYLSECVLGETQHTAIFRYTPFSENTDDMRRLVSRMCFPAEHDDDIFQTVEQLMVAARERPSVYAMVENDKGITVFDEFHAEATIPEVVTGLLANLG